jgi:hypothetical protein
MGPESTGHGRRGCKNEIVARGTRKVSAIIGIVAVAHFFSCSSILAYLKLSGFATLGMPDTWFQRFLYRVLEIIAFLDPQQWFHLYANWWNVGIVFAVNSIAWSFCLGFLIYGITSRVEINRCRDR